MKYEGDCVSLGVPLGLPLFDGEALSVWLTDTVALSDALALLLADSEGDAGSLRDGDVVADSLLVWDVEGDPVGVADSLTVHAGDFELLLNPDCEREADMVPLGVTEMEFEILWLIDRDGDGVGSPLSDMEGEALWLADRLDVTEPLGLAVAETVFDQLGVLAEGLWLGVTGEKTEFDGDSVARGEKEGDSDADLEIDPLPVHVALSDGDRVGDADSVVEIERRGDRDGLPLCDVERDGDGLSVFGEALLLTVTGEKTEADGVSEGLADADADSVVDGDSD